MLKHKARHYDDFLRLKISPSLWLLIFYGIRHLIFIAAVKLMPDDIGSLKWITIQTNSIFIFADIPAAILLLATGHRVPDAFAIMRYIWVNGRIVLISSYILSISLFLYLSGSLIQIEDLNKLSLVIFVLAPDVLAISFILRSELVKDIFSEFPHHNPA